MARPRTAPEGWGKITVKKKGARHIASTYYRGSDGKLRQYQRSGETRSAASEALQEYLKDLVRSDGSLVADSPVKSLINEWWEQYLDEKNPPAATITRYRGVIENHIIPALGELSVREARTPRLDRFIREISVSSGKSTAALARVILVGAFGLAQRYGITPANAAHGTKRVARTETTPVAWKPEYVTEVREKIAERDRRNKRSDMLDVVDFMLGTGCRPGEVFALKWEKIDLAAEPPTVRISATVTRDPETLKAEIQDFTKGKEIRVLALPDFLVAMLLRRRAESLTELVFPNSRLNLRTPETFRKQWELAVQDTPMPNSMPKQFRSTVATMLAETDVKRAKQQLGHSDVRVTEKHYVDDAEALIDNRDLLDGMLS